LLVELDYPPRAPAIFCVDVPHPKLCTDLWHEMLSSM
jgi:hypothetical protein